MDSGEDSFVLTFYRPAARKTRIYVRVWRGFFAPITLSKLIKRDLTCHAALTCWFGPRLRWTDKQPVQLSPIYGRIRISQNFSRGIIQHDELEGSPVFHLTHPWFLVQARLESNFAHCRHSRSVATTRDTRKSKGSKGWFSGKWN